MGSLQRIPERPFAVPKPAKTSSRRHEVPVEVRDAMWVRCGGRCELCKEPLRPGWDAHHRKLRSQGGDDSPSNLLALHRPCHNRVHSNRGWSSKTGFIVSATQQPGRVKLALFSQRWVRLAADASYVEAA